MPRTRSLPILALAAAALFPTAARAQFTPFEAAVAAFDAEVARGVAEDAGGAVSVAVFHGDRVVWSKGWGWADIEGRVAADTSTIGRTGSISKSFTAVLLMQLVERGVVALDDPVVRYLPELQGLQDAPVPLEEVTFRRLASHTAGLIREPELEGAASGPIQLWEEKVLASIRHTGFRTPPGTEYSYSNIGFGILGLALSRAAGVPFMELMETLVFRPLGMESTFFVLDRPDRFARMSVGYRRDGETGALTDQPATLEHFGRGYKVPNGGIYSTVGDLATFAAAVMGRTPVEILSRESRRTLVAPQPPAPAYGVGFMVRTTDDGRTLVGHGGSVAGYNADLLFDPETGLGVAMLRTTTYNPPTSELLRALVAAEGR